jgi:hypothetical protein
MSNKYNFDITVETPTYAGEVADDFYAAAVEEAVSLNNGGVTLVEGITYKQVLPTVNVADPVVASVCDFASTDSTTIDEQVLELTDLAVMEEYCVKTIRPLWHTYVRQASRHNLENPQFTDFFLAQIAKATGQSIERGIWRGTTPYGLGFQSNDGVLDETGADASIFAGFSEVDIANPLSADGAGSSVGILDALASVLAQAIADVPAILDAPGAGFYLGREAYWFYAQALSAAGSNQGQISGEGYASGNKQGLTYQGFPIYMCPGMFADTIVMSYPSNLFVGTSAGTDFNEIKAIDLRETTGDDIIRAVGRFQIGVQVANVADGVYLSSVWT